MSPAHDRVYRKTERGSAALKTRSDALPARGRTALILVNGADTLAALTQKIGPDAAAMIELLLGLGLIEEVPAPRAKAAVPPVPAAAPRPRANGEPMSAPTPPRAEQIEPLDPAGAEAQRTRLSALKREAVRRLAPQFGPDVDVVCATLLAAATDEAYRSAIAAIESKLSIYLGRNGAQQMLDGLRI